MKVRKRKSDFQTKQNKTIWVHNARGKDVYKKRGMEERR